MDLRRYAPRGPLGPLSWVDARDGYVRIWSGSGIGCVTQDLGMLADDGAYTSLRDGFDVVVRAPGRSSRARERRRPTPSGAGPRWSLVELVQPPTVIALS